MLLDPFARLARFLVCVSRLWIAIELAGPWSGARHLGRKSAEAGKPTGRNIPVQEVPEGLLMLSLLMLSLLMRQEWQRATGPTPTLWRRVSCIATAPRN
jgi:hypothetical protein